jgi:hypothetical protein
MLPPLHGQFRGVSPFRRKIHHCSRPHQVCASHGRRSAKADDFLWTRPLEAFEVQLLNELREREFPRLVLVVVELPEFLGVHSQFARHLNVRVGQAMAFLGFEPRNQLLRNFLLAHMKPRAIPGAIRQPRVTEGFSRQSMPGPLFSFRAELHSVKDFVQ